VDNEASDDAREEGHCVELSGDLDRQTAEIIHLEIRRLAKRYGLTVRGLVVERVKDASA
jgi:hypothetical protein